MSVFLLRRRSCLGHLLVARQSCRRSSVCHGGEFLARRANGSGLERRAAAMGSPRSHGSGMRRPLRSDRFRSRLRDLVHRFARSGTRQRRHRSAQCARPSRGWWHSVSGRADYAPSGVGICRSARRYRTSGEESKLLIAAPDKNVARHRPVVSYCRECSQPRSEDRLGWSTFFCLIPSRPYPSFGR